MLPSGYDRYEGPGLISSWYLLVPPPSRYQEHRHLNEADMAEPHLDHPGEIHWFKGYAPEKVLGPCPHDCLHLGRSVIAHGPDYIRYTLEQCDDVAGCNTECRAWHDTKLHASKPWTHVDWKDESLLGHAKIKKLAEDFKSSH